MQNGMKLKISACGQKCLYVTNWRFNLLWLHNSNILFGTDWIINILGQGPLNIWTEHSNCQIHSRGDSKTLIALLIPNIFLIFLWNYFSMHIKAEGMTQFDIFHVFVENSVNSELCFFWALFKPAKIWNLFKNAHVWAP